MKPFCAITGYPRSRTAWLANLLTTDLTIVYHDQPVLFPSGQWKQVGFAGPELVTQYEKFHGMFPSCPWIVIRRKPDEALAAFKKWAGDLLPQDDVLEAFWHERTAKLDDLCTKPNVESVPYAALEDDNTIRHIWELLLPDLSFDADRVKMLQNLNIQQHLTKKIKAWPLGQ